MLAVASLSACGEQRRPNPAVPAQELPDQEVSDFALTETRDGRVEWKLYARSAASYNARNLTIAQAVRVDFFNEQAERSSELVANEGEINQRTRDMVARGSVVLQTTEGTRLSTEELRFLNQAQKMQVPENQLVRVERGSDVLTGYGFESDPNLRHFVFKRAVKATVRSDTEGLVRPRDPE